MDTLMWILGKTTSQRRFDPDCSQLNYWEKRSWWTNAEFGMLVEMKLMTKP